MLFLVLPRSTFPVVPISLELTYVLTYDIIRSLAILLAGQKSEAPVVTRVGWATKYSTTYERPATTWQVKCGL